MQRTTLSVRLMPGLLRMGLLVTSGRKAVGLVLVGLTLLLAACAAPAAQSSPAPAVVPTELPVTEIESAAPATSATGTPSSPATNIPLQEALGRLEPREVFQNFYDITQVPRPSGHTDQIRAFLVSFGQGLGLETTVDETGNVLIRKPAAPGLESRQGVVLQAHMDMVPQKADGKVFDFTTDPIQALVNGDYIVADGTTLGADDGIGVAMIMAVLQANTPQVGPLEALFTVDEETDMSGANGLKGDLLKGKILINLDWETEGTFTIGSAGGTHGKVHASYTQAPAPAEMVAYQVKVEGLQGGHSGVDIHRGRGHATKLLVRLLKGAVSPFGLRLAGLSGGTVTNAIPREASSLLFVPVAQVEAFTAYVQDYEATIKAELVAVEPDLAVRVEAVQPPGQVLDEELQTILIDALYGTPQGVMRMSDAIPGLVETSNNLGIASIEDGQIEVVCYPRSALDSELQDVAQMFAAVWEMAGYQVGFSDSYSAWTPNPESPILQMMQDTYQALYGQEAAITAIHAGLECGAIGAIYPDMDMISIGPTLEHVHAPSERLFIPSVGKVMALLSELLQRMPEE